MCLPPTAGIPYNMAQELAPNTDIRGNMAQELAPNTDFRGNMAQELASNTDSPGNTAHEQLANKGNIDDVALQLDRITGCKIYCHVTKMNVTEYHANCSYRNFSHIPSVFKPSLIAKLTSLDLVGNIFKNLSSVSWEKFKSLKMLSLARNQIDTLEDGNFENLSHLEVLDLSMNQIRYTDISEGVFKPLKSLKYLDLKQALTGIREDETHPVALQQLPELRILMIDGLYDKILPYMPNLKELYLSGEYGRCNITKLDQNYFLNVKNVNHLYLSNCSIATIGNDTFGNFKNLTTLDLARNTQLGIESMPNITYGLNITKTIKHLNLNSLYDYIDYDMCTSLEENYVKYLTNTGIEMLTLEKNYIARMTDTAVDLFPLSLKYLSISDNMFMYGKYVPRLLIKGTLNNLVYFDSSKMFKNHIPVSTVFLSQVKMFDRKFSFIKSKCTKKEDFKNICDSMLTRKHVIDDLEAVLNRMRKYGIGTAKQAPKYTGKHNDQMSKKSRLKYLDLSENLPATIHMTLKLLNNVPQLAFLNVSNNFLGYPLLDEYRVLDSVKNLRTLDVSENRITHLMSDLFVNMTKLNELYLSKNRLTSVSFNLTTLKKLKYLDLSRNRLEKIDKEARKSLDNLPKLTINLANNNLMCTCKNQDFVTWLHNNVNKFDGWEETKCTFENESTLPVKDMNFDQFYLECSPPEYHAIILVVSLCILAFIFIVSCGLVYRFKWNLRYLYYMTKFKLAGGYQPIDDREYDKDVFVSYANEDRGFVRQHVVKELETDGNLSLLVHDRDFRAGELVADNIMQAITSTRRTLVILSEAYIRSKWCMYELNMARMEAVDTGRNVLFVILKEDIPVNYLPIEVIDIIKKKTYMEFPKEEVDMGLFWNRLRVTLNHEM